MIDKKQLRELNKVLSFVKSMNEERKESMKWMTDVERSHYISDTMFEIIQNVRKGNYSTLTKEEELDRDLKEIGSVEEGYEELVKKISEEYKDVTKNISLPKIISDMEKTVELKKDNQTYRNILRELKSSYNLECLFDGLEKKIDIIDFQKRFKEVFEKFRRKLFMERKYKFQDPKNLPEMLGEFFSEYDSKLFLFSLSRFINTKGMRGVKKYGIFLSQLIKNISSLKKDDFEYKSELLESIERYVSELKKLVKDGVV